MKKWAYYNEWDPIAAQWLRNLMAAGLIMQGEVDERSICDVRADDVRGFIRVGFFAGIGGWDAALQLANWPGDREVWHGSCPCQSYSVAGKGKGDDDARNLWPEFLRLIKECRPERVFGEQVSNAIKHGWLDGISSDLEAEGYACGAVVLGAHSAGAPHIRQRLFWVAESRGAKRQRWPEPRGEYGGALHAPDCRGNGGMADTECHRNQREPCDSCSEESQTSFGRKTHAGPDEIRDNGATCRLALSESLRGEQPADGEGRETCGIDSSDKRVGNPVKPRLERCGAGVRGESWDGSSGEQTSPPGHAFWSNSILIPCGDGKARRIEPGLMPLVDGVPGRVGQIRAYGNAIVPQVAAEFIMAFMELTTTLL